MSTLKPALPRTESELGRNRGEKGDNSYYYAHNEGWDVPENARVVSGPGLVVGGAPVLLGEDGQPVGASTSVNDEEGTAQSEVVTQLRSRVDALERELAQLRGGNRGLSRFSFSDEGPKCKVYVEVGEGLLERKEVTEAGPTYAEAAVAVSFTEKTCVVRVFAPMIGSETQTERRSATFALESAVFPDKCTYKVDRLKGRVSLTLWKEDPEKKWRKGLVAQAS
eukprot:TRINITY_DN30071_c0_g1_i1.p1 TRINITY_DN30071_c0_g1~~TRINITY_DN30071_c0_g1_i1.p1  ORF type:complete len:223 (+),score=51.80 TRINITY_DN30071_c0_g1_i1:91-759(+)